jgi:hypothetical protein
MPVEYLLYGIPKGETERYTEVLLLTNATPAKVEKVKELATRDGFHSFRVASIDLSVAPDFAKTLIFKKRKWLLQTAWYLSNARPFGTHDRPKRAAIPLASVRNADTDEAVFVWYFNSRNGEIMKIQLGSELTQRYELYATITNRSVTDAIQHALDDWMNVVGEGEIEVITRVPMDTEADRIPFLVTKHSASIPLQN